MPSIPVRTLIAAALALAASAAVGIASHGSAPARAPAATHQAACDLPRPTSAKQWQDAFTALHGEWEGADVASTVALPDGRTLWLFGDTLHRVGNDLAMRRNSMLISDQGCLTTVRGPGGAEPLPTRTDGHWYWPTHGVVDGGRLFVFASSVTASGDDPPGFTATGTSVAEFDLPAGKDPVLRTIHGTPSAGQPETEPQWGAAVTQHGGYTYVYGTQKVRQDLVFGRNVYVARVPAGQIADLSAWRFWDGRSWAAQESQAAVVIDARQGVPTSFSVHARPDGSFFAIAKQDDFLGSKIVSFVAATAQGQWGSRAARADSPSNVKTGAVTYLALGHPDLPLASGRLLVSVSRNNLNMGVVKADPQQYRPQFFEVG